jgi:hypothetical protein
MHEIADRCGAAGRLDAERYRTSGLGRGIDANDDWFPRHGIHLEEGYLTNDAPFMNVPSSSY